MANLKMINETVPVFLLGSCATVTTAMMSFGYYLVLGLGYFMPPHDYDPEIVNNKANEKAKEADIKDEFWRILYLIPVTINLIMLINFSLFIKEDSIMFNLGQGNDKEALLLIDKVYHKDEDREFILTALKS